MAAKPWTRRQEADALTLRRCGWTLRQIGKLFGRSESAVCQRLHLLKSPPVRRKAGELERVVRWYCVQSRWEDWEVALFLNLSTKTVANCRRRLGIPAKNQAQSLRVRSKYAGK